MGQYLSATISWRRTTSLLFLRIISPSYPMPIYPPSHLCIHLPRTRKSIPLCALTLMMGLHIPSLLLRRSISGFAAGWPASNLWAEATLVCSAYWLAGAYSPGSGKPDADSIILEIPILHTGGLSRYWKWSNDEQPPWTRLSGLAFRASGAALLFLVTRRCHRQLRVPRI